MKVFLSGDVYILVLEVGEKVLDSLKKFARENDFCGFMIGIGALKDPIIAYFDKEEKEYKHIELKGDYELTSLLGNIGRLENGEIVPHVHVTLGNNEGKILGGHLIEGEVGVTVEIFLTKTKCFVRKKDNVFNLNLIMDEA